MSGHTPGPWTTRPAKFGGDVGIVAPDCACVIAECFEEFAAKGDIRPVEAAANAEFIVRACNAHEELLEALRTTLENLGSLKAGHAGVTVYDEWERAVKAVIAKAEGR